ncbi:MAG: hypothetical protein AMJ73_04060 [candidate division Zixibacteria bacterium SM1_73]|nr:MAG: hypothetical protein AMJ73_04060 [candidate division Zixibacteria bacterium SM1_73]
MKCTKIIINQTNKEEGILRINTIDELAERLGHSPGELKRIANTKIRYYKVNEKIKPSGKLRTLYEPMGPLSKILKLIKERLLDGIELPECMHGYRTGRDYISNACVHVGKNIICKLDIKNFFPSIHHGRVFNILMDLGCSKQVAKLLTRLVTCDNHTPQGFNTSPTLSNIVVSNLARRLQGLCNHYRLTLTIYSDDITISGNIEQKKFEGLFYKELLPIIEEIIKQEGFSLNFGKIKLVKRRDSQKVTGIIVNKKPNIPKQKRRELLSTIKEYQMNGVSISHDSDLLKVKQSLRGKIANAQRVNRSFGQLLLREFEKIDWSRRVSFSSN